MILVPTKIKTRGLTECILVRVREDFFLRVLIFDVRKAGGELELAKFDENRQAQKLKSGNAKLYER